jgi:hypothetical protein
LAARRIRAIEQFIADTADRLWNEALRNGRIEWMGAVANRLPMMVVAELIGVPETDTAKLVKWGYAATQLLEGLVSQDQLTASGVAVMELSGYIHEQFDRAAADPHDNLRCELATACAAGEVDAVTAQAMMVILFAAGGESTASLLGSATWMLAQRPDIQQQVRENPELLTAFIEETLRYEPPFRGHYRHCATAPPWVASTCPPTRICCFYGGRPTAIRLILRHPMSSASIAPKPRGTSPLEREHTSASVRRWHVWRLRSFCACCSIAPRRSKRSTWVGGFRASWCAASSVSS